MKSKKEIEMKKPAELTDEALEKAAGGIELSRHNVRNPLTAGSVFPEPGRSESDPFILDSVDDLKPLADILSEAPGASAVIPIIFASAEDAAI